MIDLAGKPIAITGARRGIGRAPAIAYAAAGTRGPASIKLRISGL